MRKIPTRRSGPFGSPRVSAVSAMESLVGPITDLYRKAKQFIQGRKCEVLIKALCSNLQYDSRDIGISDSRPATKINTALDIDDEQK